jgi:V/A-type H+-transporting ATPase subunit C
MEELIGALAQTRYGKLLAELRQKAGDEPGIYAAGLDIYYCQQAWKRKDKLSEPGMRRIFTEVLGNEIDWLNILWIYRAKRFFQMKPVDIYAESIPVYYRLSGQEYRNLVETETVEEFLARLQTTAYFKGKDAVVQMGDEITYRKIMDRTYEGLCRRFPASIAPVLKYLYDKENEIDALTTILEGIRYQIPSRDIRELVLVTE